MKLLFLFIALLILSGSCSKHTGEEPIIPEVPTDTLLSIAIKSLPAKKTYTLEEPLSLEGMIIEATYRSGKKKEIPSPSADSVKGFDSSQPALKQTLQLSLNNQQFSFDITVLPVKVSGDEIVSSKSSDFKTLILPDGIRSIKECAFSNNTSIEEVVFPASIEKIGKEAFEFCSKLKKVDLSKTSIHELPDNIFISSGVEEVTLPSTLKKVGAMAFYGTKGLKELTLPEGTEEIGLTAFTQSNIESITIPNTVYFIDRAFYQCEKLTTVKVTGAKTTTPGADKTAKIVEECFSYCPELTTLEIPRSIKVIGGSVLDDSKVRTLVLPESVKTLGFNAFGNNSSLEEITLNSPEKVFADDYPVPGTIQRIKVPQNLVEVYKKDKSWMSFAEKIIAL